MSLSISNQTHYERLFYEALRIRKAEEKIVDIFPSDKIQSPVHLSIGQEHHVVALCANLKVRDKAFTTYRNHALYLAKGGSMKKMFAELYGKRDGVSKGKAGSMHLCSPDVNLLGSSAIVGAVFSHAMGLAYSEQFKKSGNIVVCISGEGATEEGTFHECLNFSSLKKLPIIYLVENNGLAIHTPVDVRQSYALSKLTKAYDIDYHNFDGYDLEGFFQFSKDLIHSIKNRPRPVIIEVDTYRHLQHVGIEKDYDKGYRPISEYQKWEERDPLIVEKDLIKKYSEKIDQEISEALIYAEKSPLTEKCELLTDVY
jgi:TPP-dependent pyruvate/acetoin dehydrogenase alpha subunit